jgi:TctA family transporter
MQGFSFVIIILVALLCIVVAHRMAERKGLNAVLWGVLAGVFGPLIFPILILMPSKKSPDDLN